MRQELNLISLFGYNKMMMMRDNAVGNCSAVCVPTVLACNYVVGVDNANQMCKLELICGYQIKYRFALNSDS